LNAHPGQLTFEAVGEALALFLCGEADFDASLAMITAA
jgi:hypothetical protein